MEQDRSCDLRRVGAGARTPSRTGSAWGTDPAAPVLKPCAGPVRDQQLHCEIVDVPVERPMGSGSRHGVASRHGSINSAARRAVETASLGELPRPPSGEPSDAGDMHPSTEPTPDDVLGRQDLTRQSPKDHALCRHAGRPSESGQRWSPAPVPPSSRWPKSRCHATCSGVSWR
jgi:hypothetical protein